MLNKLVILKQCWHPPFFNGEKTYFLWGFPR